MEFRIGRGRGMPGMEERREMRVIRSSTQDEMGGAAARLMRLCEDAAISKKLDRALELAAKVAARRAAPIPDMKGVSSLSEMARHPGPSASQAAAQWSGDYATRQARLCAESEAAYAARNPHKRGGSK